MSAHTTLTNHTNRAGRASRGCAWCAYEQSIDRNDSNGAPARVSLAETYVRTPAPRLVANDDGWRAVCADHARRGTWRGGPMVAT